MQHITRVVPTPMNGVTHTFVWMLHSDTKTVGRLDVVRGVLVVGHLPYRPVMVCFGCCQGDKERKAKQSKGKEVKGSERK